MKNSTLPIKIFISLLMLGLISFFVYAQKSIEPDEIQEIDEYVKTLDTLVDSQSPDFIFVDVSQTDKPKWQKFESENAFKEFQKTPGSYASAYNWQSYNWLKNGKIVAVGFTYHSESGDWIKYSYLFFREDGTLAKAGQLYNTFHGNFSLIQDIYFDRKGNILKDSSKYLDLETKKTVEPSEGDILDNGDNLKPFYFKTTNQLPYSHLLKD